VAAAVALPAGAVRYLGPPPVLVPIAARPAAPELRQPVPLSLAEPDIGPGPPALVELGLTETTPLGALPRTATDGTRPLARYARPAPGSCRRPCVAVLVTGLGLVEGLSERALALPADVALSFSPYSAAARWQARARAAGHEVLLGLPLQPARALDDAGPLSIAADQAPSAIAALRRVLVQGSGYVALDAEAGAFAMTADAFAPLAGELRVRGLALIELGGTALSGPARTAGLAYAGAVPIDREPMPEAIDRALAGLAAAATRDGRALAAAGPLPAGLERLAAWIAGLPAQGIELVPPSRLLLDEIAPAVARR
jgi:polysaccharide deacetylase 2 family uncharacterized protein YibQ